MIYKNVTVGKIEGVTICEFGTGDIGVSTAKYADGKQFIYFANQKAPITPIGSDISENYGKTSDETGIDVSLEFTKVESVQVLIDALERLKAHMIEIGSNPDNQSK